MLSSRKILKLYIISTLLSGLCLLLFLVLPLPPISFGDSQGPEVLKVICISSTIYYSILNLVFFIPLNKWIFKALLVKGSIVLFLLPSIGFLLLGVIKFNLFDQIGDVITFFIPLGVNITCIGIGAYFVFRKSATEDELA